jgi:predicted NUDIX family NTP pyrophosphohydrolase
MSASSAGLLLYRIRDGRLEVLIGHMGGPFWARKDAAAWSIPKGEYDEETEDPYAAARREFEEETGARAPDGSAIELGEIRQRNGKRVRAWALEGDLDPAGASSNTFTLEWPPRSGEMQEFPEIDRLEWCELELARERLVAGQEQLLDALCAALAPPARTASKGPGPSGTPGSSSAST